MKTKVEKACIPTKKWLKENRELMQYEIETLEIVKSGVNTRQAQTIMAFIGSIKYIKKTGKEKLKKELIRIPGVAEKTTDKIIKYFKP